MKSKKFSTLQLNKKAVAKLNKSQLNIVKGGAVGEGCTHGGCSCINPSTSMILTTKIP